jgi:hypothetical protein
VSNKVSGLLSRLEGDPNNKPNTLHIIPRRLSWGLSRPINKPDTYNPPIEGREECQRARERRTAQRATTTDIELDSKDSPLDECLLSPKADIQYVYIPAD